MAGNERWGGCKEGGSWGCMTEGGRGGPGDLPHRDAPGCKNCIETVFFLSQCSVGLTTDMHVLHAAPQVRYRTFVQRENALRAWSLHAMYINR